MRDTDLRHSSSSWVRPICLLIFAALLAAAALAQSGDREARAALWESYKIPEGEFTRYVDRQKGFSFWHPANWQERAAGNGNRFFQPAPQGINLFVMTEEIPDGYGVANYASSVLQGLRNQPVAQESVTVRRVILGGLEWREIAYNVEPQGGGLAHQTMWFTAVGPRVYGFVLSVAAERLEQDEPVLKRIVTSVRIGAAGHWDEQFETLRTKFAARESSTDAYEIQGAMIAEELRAARQSPEAIVARVSDLFGKAPGAALALLTDADPQVRTAAITALGRVRRDELSNEALVWALSDTDVFAGTAAAQALAARGAAGLTAIKNKIPVPRALRPEAMVRGGIALGEPFASDLIAELLRTGSANDHLGALQLALAMPRLGVTLPCAKLLASPNLGVRFATVAVLQQHRHSQAAMDATAELLDLLRGDNEDWAARALGETAPMAVAAELDKRIAEIDARLTALGKPKSSNAARTNQPKPAAKTATPDDAADAISQMVPTDLKTKPEDVRLAIIRGHVETAARKIRFRSRWETAQTEAARRAILAEIRNAHSDLIDWAQATLFRAVETARAIPAINAARLASAPSTGETLFPKSTVSYVMAPNFAATMEKLDAALSGVQMTTVRDQMTFALVLKLLKASLAEKTGTSMTGDAARAIGIDLKSPMALATWTVEASAAEKENAATRSAVVVRVLDRTRFERLLAMYQDEFGDLNSFSTIAAAASRFAGVIPAALPVIFATLAADETNNAVAQRIRASSTRPAAPSLKPFAWIQQEKLGDLPITILNKPVISQSGGVTWGTIYLAYLGETAVIASSKSALADVIATGMGEQASLAQSDAFRQSSGPQLRAGQSAGEMIFFSDLPALLQATFGSEETGADKTLHSFLKVFGSESGALHISPTSWETHFNVRLLENEFTASFIPFKADALMAPRDLLPQSTVLYAGAVSDPPKLLAVLKKLDESGATGGGSGIVRPETRATGLSRGKELEEIIEKQLVPQMSGEIGAAVISFNPIFDNGDWPATVFAARLKSKDLAEAMRAGNLFAKFKRVSNASALGSPIIALGEDDAAPFAVVTESYFLLADSLETLKALEAREKFSASRDFARSLANVPDRLALFATYNLEAAFEEASKVLNGKESQRMLPFLSALVHAFHSQRAFVTMQRDGQTQMLNGRLAVSFDREGRYAVGDLTRGGDFDVANAVIATKGLSVIQSPRVEAMTLRVTARGAAIAARVRDDLAKFPWQHVQPQRDAANDATFVFTTTARHIPADLTLRLPVTGAEFAPFLNPTPQINSQAPEVVALAKQIAGEDKDAHSVARKIGDWTYQNLKWKKVESDVVDTLASREADCLEHSELYVALARAVGLPARVVTGAALSGGSFGSHAWVEIFLGRWVELDPTWGLMEHVDATHLRFDGDAFTSYAMLNQLDLEVTAARRTVADFQRDPIRLVKEFSLNAGTRDLAFDLPLTVKQTIGDAAWEKLDERQRAAVIEAFERTVKGMWETWKADLPEPVRVLRRELSADRAIVTVLRGEALLRLNLARRDGAWFITEHEIVDDALPEFADALAGALRPAARRGRIYEVSFDAALKHLDRLLSTEGEKPELLLLKARVMSAQQSQQRLEQLLAAANQEKAPAAEKGGNPEPRVEENAARPPDDPVSELWRRLTLRWPDFAQGHLARARDLLNTGETEDSLNPISKDTVQAVASLQRYAQLVPDDPRPWRELAQAYEQMEKFAEAERAYRAAIERDRTYLDHHAVLVNFLLDREDLVKAKAAFAEMLKAAPSPDDVFAYLDDEEGFDADEAKLREELLAAFPNEVAASKPALSLLASLQEAQNKLAEAVRSTQRAIAIEPEADDYETLSRLYRKQRRFTEALSAADQAWKLDDSALSIQFERGCSLAQLGRKREAIAALKQLVEGDQASLFDADDPDLQPLAAMPEFKALKEKLKEALAPQKEKQDEPAKPGQPNKPSTQ